MRKILRPSTVSNYVKYIGGVDLLDQRCKTYLFPHRSRKWYKRLFNHIIMMAMINAHIIYTSVTADKQKQTFKDFICAISNHYSQSRKITISRPRVISRKRFDALHIAVAGARSAKCAFCSTKEHRVRTVIFCKACNVHLCVRFNKNCFLQYHTQP